MKKIIGILTATCFFVILSVSSYAQKTIEKPAKPAAPTTTAPAKPADPASTAPVNTTEDKGDRVEKKGSRTKTPKVGRNQNGQDNINKTQRNSSGANKSKRTKALSSNGNRTAPVERKKTTEGKNRG
jgi:hypothetical protein